LQNSKQSTEFVHKSLQLMNAVVPMQKKGEQTLYGQLLHHFPQAVNHPESQKSDPENFEGDTKHLQDPPPWRLFDPLLEA